MQPGASAGTVAGVAVLFTDAPPPRPVVEFMQRAGVELCLADGGEKLLLDLYGIPAALLPEVLDTAADFGTTQPGVIGGAVAIGAMAGNQQAALVGHACFAPGDAKCTYGTGAFMIANTGAVPVASTNRLLTTVCYRLDGVTTYALEGSIFVTGAHLVRATLEAVCFQTRDLIEAMRRDGIPAIPTLRVDGGMTANDWLMDRMAGLTGLPVKRAAVTETTALGVACLAGLQAGLYGSLDEIARRRAPDRVWQPSSTVAERDAQYAGWHAAVQRARS